MAFIVQMLAGARSQLQLAERVCDSDRLVQRRRCDRSVAMARKPMETGMALDREPQRGDRDGLFRPFGAHPTPWSEVPWAHASWLQICRTFGADAARFLTSFCQHTHEAVFAWKPSEVMFRGLPSLSSGTVRRPAPLAPSF